MGVGWTSARLSPRSMEHLAGRSIQSAIHDTTAGGCTRSVSADPVSLPIRCAITQRGKALRRKISAEASAEAFVSDKTVIDYLAYWLQNQSEQELRNVNEEFLELCKEAAKRYDVLVLLPYRAEVSYAIGRNQDPVHNLKVAAHKLGLLILLELPYVRAPYQFGEDLGAWCAQWLPPITAEQHPAAASEVTE